MLLRDIVAFARIRPDIEQEVLPTVIDVFPVALISSMLHKYASGRLKEV